MPRTIGSRFDGCCEVHGRSRPVNACRRQTAARRGGSPFFGLPRLRIDLAGVTETGVRSGFSRASISVESREMRPIDLSCCVAWMSASCKEGFVQTLGKFRRGEFGKRPRELRPMRDLAPTLPTADAPQGYIDRQAIQQLPRGIQMEHRFGDKGPRDGPPVPGRPTHAARPGGDQPLNFNHAQHRCQLTMLVRQRAQLLIERREQYALQDASACL